MPDLFIVLLINDVRLIPGELKAGGLTLEKQQY